MSVKCLTTSAGGVGWKSWFIASADFHAVNTLNFKISSCHHDVAAWGAGNGYTQLIRTRQCKPAPAHYCVGMRKISLTIKTFYFFFWDVITRVYIYIYIYKIVKSHHIPWKFEICAFLHVSYILIRKSNQCQMLSTEKYLPLGLFPL